MELVEGLAGRCLIAIPKKGRLYERCLQFLKSIDIRYVRKDRLDIALSSNFNVALVFLPASDIALYASEGRVDLGITGQDIVAESGVEVDELMRLGFGKCKLCVQAPKKHNIKSSSELVGKRILTSFPNLATKHFQKLDPVNPTTVKYVSGSVEVACPLGVADAVVDLVESGTTMQAAGLEIIDVIMETEAVLIANKHSTHKDLIERIRKRIAGTITAEKYVMVEYNIPRNKLPEAERITPGMRSPTICPLEDPEWVAVKSMVLKTEANDILDKLEEIGATAILIFNIHNCRT